MKDKQKTDAPCARKNGIITQDLNGETLVYDLERNNATCLNNFAAEVWSRCGGQLTAQEIADALPYQNVDKRQVWLALDRLSRANLLEPSFKVPTTVFEGKSRRDFIKGIGASAALIPVVTVLTVPTAAQAASLAGLGEPCQNDADCESGSCSPGNECV